MDAAIFSVDVYISLTNAVIQSCQFPHPHARETGEEKEVKQIHSSLTTRGLTAQPPQLSAQIILKYSKLRCPRDALSLFRDVNLRCGKTSSFLWNTMIRAYVNNGQFLEAVELYSVMCKNRVSPDNYTYPFVLRACPQCGRMVHVKVINAAFSSDIHVGESPGQFLCEMRAVNEGLSGDSITLVTVATAVGQVGDHRTARLLHAYALRNGISGDICLSNSLVAMYAKCGNVVSALTVFDRMDEKDGISWRSILSGYVQNGLAGEAIKLFPQMQETGRRPNPVTMLIIVSGCAVHGSSTLRRKIHDIILVLEIKIDAQLRNALTDMYAKCGGLETAVEMFDSTPL
ncbi:hypothetical protein CDL15_Pgr019432 [Punica granatum]|uniref:Pentatricopeptide repeat-containing protein n=1 Tax=Punica granatum TaxID=22663 RepID=A0A218XSQ4_PUNGR|nr:hypothetical protein CDL15_Pgr019432 [Punica granatum]